MLSKAWTNKQFKAANADVKARDSVRGAALLHGILHSSFHDHVTGKAKKRLGRPETVLEYTIEKEIATSCMVLQEYGFPMTKPP